MVALDQGIVFPPISTNKSFNLLQVPSGIDSCRQWNLPASWIKQSLAHLNLFSLERKHLGVDVPACST